MDKTFTIVGVSTLGKITKFRVANGDLAARLKVLERNEHTDITLIELSPALSKTDAINHFKATRPEYDEIRMPNEKNEPDTLTKVKTVTIKKGKTTDAATTLLNDLDTMPVAESEEVVA
jgi:hypothetical protein